MTYFRLAVKYHDHSITNIPTFIHVLRTPFISFQSAV